MGKAQYIILAVILVVTVLSGWLLNLVEVGTGKTPSRPPHIPDYYFDQFTTTVMGENSRPRYKLSAAHLDHYPDDDSKVLTALQLDFYPVDEASWQISAEHGLVTARNRLIRLTGKVRLVRAATPQRPAVTLDTDELLIYPKEKRARTDTLVMIRAGRDTIRARGLRVDLNTGQLELLANVQGHYEPPPRTPARTAPAPR